MDANTEFDRRRLEVGERVRDLRKRAAFTGMRLATEAGIQQARISRIERGQVTPRVSEIEQLMDVLSPTKGEREDLVALVSSLHNEYASWRLLMPHGDPDQRQDELAAYEAGCTNIREFAVALVPGLLQTPPYAQQMFENWDKSFAPTQVADAVRARLDRQNLLFENTRKFEFVLTESALDVTQSDSSVMAAQCHRIIQIDMMPNVSISILPNGTQLPSAPITGFILYDDKALSIDTAFGAIVLTDERDLDRYLATFEGLNKSALHDEEAKAFLDAKARRFVNN